MSTDLTPPLPSTPSPTPPPPPPAPPGPRRSLWLGLGLAIVLFLGFSYWYDQSTSKNQADTASLDDRITPSVDETVSRPPDLDDRSNNSSSVFGTKAALPARTVTETGAFKLMSDRAGTCTLQKPSDWGKPVAAEGSRGVDVANTEKTMYAGYGIQPINTQLASYAGYYQPPLNDPDLYSENPATVTLAYAKILVNGLGGSADLAYTSEVNETLGDYALRSVSSSTHRGVLFYHTQGFPGDGYNYTYALPMRFALTRGDLWASKGLMVARVTASISCTATLVPRASSGGIELGGSSSDSGKDENGTDAGYNPQLGTEEVHDPTTGENYVVDPSQHWSETGPNGPGYYAGKGGGDYVHLEPGRVD